MWEVLGGLFVASAVSGIVPLVNAELLVIGAIVAAPGAGVAAVAAVSTLGQMTTKTLLFWLARAAPARLPERAKKALARASTGLSGRKRVAGSIVFTSAAVGLPPFYGVSLVCGALGMRLSLFLLTGTAGRAIRFGVLAWAGGRFGTAALELIGLGDSAMVSMVGP